MKLARVIGTVVNTIKIDPLNGFKLMWVEPIDENGERCEPPMVAVDTVQAGPRNIVLVCQEGKSSRLVMNNKEAPVEALILGVVDHFDIHGEQKTLREDGTEVK